MDTATYKLVFELGIVHGRLQNLQASEDTCRHVLTTLIFCLSAVFDQGDI